MHSFLRRLKRRLHPALVLFFLAPGIGELLSGSMPPAEFFNPFGLLMAAVLYGGGAIIVRELALRWGKGWATIVVLGAAYGILEEGLLCKSFFDPNWPDLGHLAQYGRWAGVNWIWAIQLTVYHTAVSICTSIFIVSMLYAERRHESWVSRRGFNWFAGLLAADTLLGLVAFGGIPKQPYHPPVFQYLLAMASVVGLYYLAKSLPPKLLLAIDRRVPRPFWFWLIGFSYMVGFFAVPHILYATHVPAPIAGLVCLATITFVVWLILRLSGNGAAWNDFHRLALVAGSLSLFILFGPLQELDNARRPDNTTGMAAVGVFGLLCLLVIYDKVKRSRSMEEAMEEVMISSESVAEEATVSSEAVMAETAVSSEAVTADHPGDTATRVHGNTSGGGVLTPVPPEIRGWNWGAFFLSWVWGACHNTWGALICLLPIAWPIMIFVMGAKGSEWAWQNRHFAGGVEEFQAVQRKWARWGVVAAVVSIFFLLALGSGG